MNRNPVEISTHTSSLLREPDELLLAWFLIQKEPPYIHLRAIEDAVEEVKNLSEKSRAEILGALDRLLAEFKQTLGAPANPVLCTRGPHPLQAVCPDAFGVPCSSPAANENGGSQ